MPRLGVHESSIVSAMTEFLTARLTPINASLLWGNTIRIFSIPIKLSQGSKKERVTHATIVWSAE